VSPFKKKLGKKIGNSWIQRLIGLKTNPRFEELYGDFELDRSFRGKTIEGLEQESGKIYGGIIDFLESLKSLEQPISRVLLAGDNNVAKPVYSHILGVGDSAILTAGIMDDMDYQWDYNEAPPADIGLFDCVISQSMYEHLIDPYKHFKDSLELLNDGGVLIIHTMMPGFNYHRYPVDCFRFYPDWFEVLAEKHGLTVLRKHIRNCRITYALQKSAA